MRPTSGILESVDRVLRAILRHAAYMPSTTLMDAEEKNGQIEINVSPIFTQEYGPTGWQLNVEILSVVPIGGHVTRQVGFKRALTHGDTNVGENEALKETFSMTYIDYQIAFQMTFDAATHIEAISRLEEIVAALYARKGEIEAEAKVRDVQFMVIGPQAIREEGEARQLLTIQIAFVTTLAYEHRVDYRESGIIGSVQLVRVESDEE